MNEAECANPECQEWFNQTDDGEDLCPECFDDYEVCPECGLGQANYMFADDETGEPYDLCEECRGVAPG